jgi:hypothetical protein
MKWAFFIVAFLALSGAKAQTVQRQMAARAVIRPDTTFTMISGIIKNADNGSPMPGCTVRIKGKTTGTQTDVRGQFYISATYKDTLLISLVGYNAVVIPLHDNAKNINQSGLTIWLQYISTIGYGVAAARRPPVMAMPMPRTEPVVRSRPQVAPSPVSRMLKTDIADFPFPPPEGYTERVLDKNMFTNCKTLEDADQIILNAINHCKYDDHSYYAIPDGFALVTKVEEMNQDGSSVLNNDRFSVNRGLSMTLLDWFAPRRGYFRVFAFLVTDKAFKATKQPVSVGMAEGWVTQGVNVLPDEIGGESFGDDYRCTVIVYEFNAPDANVKLQLINPPRLTANTHLDKSNISRFLIP